MYDLVVIGGGSGGLNVASAAARVGAKVAMIEKHKLGGECTHTACVPSKALIRAARIAHDTRRAGEFGINLPEVRVDFAAVMARVRGVVAGFAGSDSGEGLEAKGISVHRGSPRFEAYDTILLDADEGGEQRIHGRRFVVTTGSRPAIPAIEGLAEAGYLDNTTFWDLQELPASLLVIGGGPVGLELGQAMSRLGTKVTVVQSGERIMPMEDPEVSACLGDLLRAEGLDVQENATVTGVATEGGLKVVRFRVEGEDAEREARVEQILVAAGRLANVEGLNLHALGIEASPEHGIAVDDYLRTRAPNVFAIGDVLGHHQWTHAAEREAATVFQNAVLKIPKKIDYRAVPWATFTAPEVATVGVSEAIAREADPEVRAYRVGFDDVHRAIIDGETSGFAKVVVDRSGTILGATVIGQEASGILQEFVLAMERGLGLGDIAKTVHPYPTYPGIARSLANQFLAGRLEKGSVRTALRWIYGFDPSAS